jgi:hypothetical protein
VADRAKRSLRRRVRACEASQARAATTNLDPRYVNLSGDTMTDTLNISETRLNITNATGEFRVQIFPPGLGIAQGTQLIAALKSNSALPQMRFETGANSNFIDIWGNVSGSFVVESNDVARLIVKADGEVQAARFATGPTLGRRRVLHGCAHRRDSRQSGTKPGNRH